MKKIYNDCTEWRNERGELHRLDGPARIYTDGTKHWIIDGQYHRVDGPAVEHASGVKTWFFKGKWLSEQEWFEALNSEDQIAYLFKINF